MNELLLEGLLSPSAPPLIISTIRSAISLPLFSSGYCVPVTVLGALGYMSVGRGKDQNSCPRDYIPVREDRQHSINITSKNYILC